MKSLYSPCAIVAQTCGKHKATYPATSDISNHISLELDARLCICWHCPHRPVSMTIASWHVRTSGALGWAATLDILLMMYPVPRSTFLHWMMGESFPTLIKYHRYGSLQSALRPSRCRFSTVGPDNVGHRELCCAMSYGLEGHYGAGCRWIGHGTMLIITLHGFGFYGVWLFTGEYTRGLVWDRTGAKPLFMLSLSF